MVRDKLVELIGSTEYGNKSLIGHNFQKGFIEKIADHLIDNGVTVQEWYSANNPPKEDGTYLVQTTTGTITTARFYAFKSFPATKSLPACHRSPAWQSNRNVVKWTFLPKPPKGDWL